MVSVNDLKQSSFLVYGLGLTGKSVINFFKKNKIKNYQVWDDKDKKSFKLIGTADSSNDQGSGTKNLIPFLLLQGAFITPHIPHE